MVTAALCLPIGRAGVGARASQRGNRSPGGLCVPRRLAAPRSTATQTRCSKPERTPEPAEAASDSVPWQPARFTIAFSQILCLQLALAYGSVGAWAGITGQQLDGTNANEVDAVLLLSDVVQLLGVLAVIRLSLQPAGSPSQALEQPTPSFPADPPAAPAAAQQHATPFRYTLDAQVLGIALAAAAAALLAVALLSQASGETTNPGAEPEISALLRSSGPAGSALLLLSTVVVGPITEELVWRGLLLPSLSAWTGAGPALAVSSLGFAAYHLLAAELPALTLLGAALGYAMLRSGGNLLAPTLGHALYNLVALGFAAQQAQQALP